MKPILFNGEMIRAILEGRKVQTRRVVKLPKWSTMDFKDLEISETNNPEITCYKTGCLARIESPYQVGDILYVRETWWHGDLLDANGNITDSGVYLYKADEPNIPGWPDCEYKWKRSIHMPKETARIFLKVTNVRVERIQDISEEDAKKEGAEVYAWGVGDISYHGNILKPNQFGFNHPFCYKNGFSILWESVYGNWNENCWVWVIEFERCTRDGENFG